MNIDNLVDGFDFDNHRSFNQQIEFDATFQGLPLVVDRYIDLTFH